MTELFNSQAAPLGLRYEIRFCYKQDIPNGIGSYNPIGGELFVDK